MKPILGFEGLYSITEDGKVFSHLKNKFLAPKRRWQKGNNKPNYVQVGLYKNKRVKIESVHRLVAIAYIPNPDNKPQINHINNDREDNSISNLEWVSAKENIAHAIAAGIVVPGHNKGKKYKSVNKGVRHGQSKFTEEEVRYIRNNYKARDKEFNSCALAKKFAVCQPVIHAILGVGKRKTYVDVI